VTWAFLPSNTPAGFAHRGGTDIAPGNTMASFHHAVDKGYQYIETDVRLTADGVLVLFHDDDLSPTTDSSGAIEDQTWAQLSKVRIDGHHPIARLDELVETFPNVKLNIEPKSDRTVEALASFIADRVLVEKVCVGSFSGERVRRIRRLLGPRLCTSPGPLGVAICLMAAIVWPRWTPPYGCVQIPASFKSIPILRPWLVRRLHRLGLQVHVWTINDRPTMIRLLDWGVDVIMTDRVELLASVLNERN